MFVSIHEFTYVLGGVMIALWYFVLVYDNQVPRLTTLAQFLRQPLDVRHAGYLSAIHDYQRENPSGDDAQPADRYC